jgi:malonyl-CoA O-methyltransferase
MNTDPRFDMQRVQKAFGASATQYDQHAGLQQDIRDECLTLAKIYWHDGANILDLGTGTGALAQSVKEQGLGWHISGLDVSFDMCKIARAHAPSVNANAEALPFANAAFDGIFSSLMLQWVNNPLQLFKEMLRVIKPGGRCILSAFIHGTLDELRASFATLDNAVHVNDFGPPNYFSALAVHAGFRVLSSEEQTITDYYADVSALMRGLKAIGASTKQQGQPRQGLMTPRQLSQLEQAYRSRFVHVDGLPASWQVMILLLERP